MKKYFLITLVLMAFATAASAQNKRIAILETIDKEDKVPYAVEVMVRSNLTKVISNTEGYEGYDRVNISQIMDEHEFERTGLVNEDQIRQLGEISGADYLLVSEAVKFDESNIFITAKILNVESAKTEGSENALMGMTAQDIQDGCESLANRLLGLPDPTMYNQANSSNTNTQSVQPSVQQPEEKPIEEPLVAENIKIENPRIFSEQIQNNGYITRKGKTYYQDGNDISKDYYVNLLETSCPQAYSSYNKGRTTMIFGWIILGAGVGVAAAFSGRLSTSATYYGNTLVSSETHFNYTGPIIGGALVACSIPLIISGTNRKNNAYKIYNQYCVQSSASLSFGPTANGIGICLSF